MRCSSSRWDAPVVAAVATVALGGLVGCGAAAAGAPETDASPAAEVSHADGAAAVSTPENRSTPPDTPDAAALAYAAFAAGGEGSAVPFAPRVTYRVGGVDVATLTAREAARPGPWRACPPGSTTYEGRDCPVSPLGSLALLDEAGAPAQVERGWPGTVGCTRVEPAEVGEGSTAVSLRPPPQRRDCFSDLGVLLRVDPGGRVDLVELVLSGS